MVLSIVRGRVDESDASVEAPFHPRARSAGARGPSQRPVKPGDPFFLPEQLLLAGDEQADVGRAAVHRLHDGGCHNHRRLRDRWCVPADQGEGVVLARPEPELGAQTPEGDAGDPG